MTMSLERIALKRRLLDERRVMRRSGSRVEFVNACEICGNAVDALDLHEVIISRGDVRGNDELLRKVTESEYNVALVDKRCHTDLADTDWGHRLLTDRLIDRYGSRAILSWITMLNLKAPGDFLNFVVARAMEVEKT